MVPKEWDERSPNFMRLLQMPDIYSGGRRFLATRADGPADHAGVDYVMKGGRVDVPISARVNDYWAGWFLNPTFTIRYDYPLRPQTKTEWHRLMDGKAPAGFLMYAMMDEAGDGYLDALLVNLEALRVVLRLGAVEYDVRSNKGAFDPGRRDSRFAVIPIAQFHDRRAVISWRLSEALAAV